MKGVLNASLRLGEGATPYKNEDTGNNTVTNATPTIVHRGCVTRWPFSFKVTYSHKQTSLVILTADYINAAVFCIL
jgi:hypothetical protein